MDCKKIVIANSIGIDSNGLAIIHSPSRWTNSSKDKNVFTYYPWELAYTSALLKSKLDCYVKFIDPCLEKLNIEETFNAIKLIEPDFLLMEPATRTWDDDSELMLKVKKEFGTKIIVAGQHATAFPEEVGKIADYVLIGEYELTVLEILQGKDVNDILGLFPNQRRELLDVNALPWPEDEDISRLDYGIPGEPSSEFLEIQAYASRGCPMNCNFCAARHLYYAKSNWRSRNPKNVAQELKYLKNKYPQVEGIFFDEEVHNTKKAFILDLCKEIRNTLADNLKIDAMCTYYTLDEEMMDAMKSAGYYLLRVGIETAGENAAKGINLGAKFNIKKLRNVLNYAKKINLKMYGTFTFGAPGSTRQDDAATLDLMTDIINDGLLWKFQTSICTPQPGTPFFSWAKEKGFIRSYDKKDYDGGNNVVLDYPDYKHEEIMKMYVKAQKFFDFSLKEKIKSKLDDSLEKLKGCDLRQILVLRTSRMLQMEVVLRGLRNTFPDISIDVLGQDSVQTDLNVLSRDGIVDEIINIPDGFLSPKVFETPVIDKINSKKYDHIFCVYNNLMGNGYLKVEQLMNMFHPEEWMAFNAEGNLLSQDVIVNRRAKVECSEKLSPTRP